MAELIGKNNKEKIWNFLISKGYTKAGVSGLMGNLDAESGLSTNNLENSRNDDLGSDTYYTAAVNNKTYSKDSFVNDKAGYGLAQWTYFTRKRGLYEATVEQGLSVADLGGQLEYLIKELATSYKSLNSFLKTTTSVDEASDKFLKEFERPAIPNYDDRRKRIQNYYDEFANSSNKEEFDTKTEESEYKTYTVVNGDSWWGIASKFLGSGTKMAELAEFNNTDTNAVLHPGDVIKLPILRDDLVTESNSNNTISNTNYYTIYTVKKGDSWWSIAAAKMGNGNKMAELAKFNGKTTKDIIHPGNVLKIPK